MSLAMSLAFLVFLLIGTPIAFCLGLSGVIGFLFYDSSFLTLVPQRMYAAVSSFPLMAVPFFVLAGDLMGTSGILERLVRFAEILVGHIRGGLAHVNIVASMIFAGISGSAVADASALGTALIPGMEKKFGKPFAAAVCASAATIGPIIPPSIPMVVYAYVVGQVSIGGLFLAGVVPGLLMGFGMMAIVYVIGHRRKFERGGQRASLREMVAASYNASWALLMPVIILGGILGGIFTATEAAAVSVAYAVFVGRFITHELTWRHLGEAVSRCARVSAVVFILLGTSNVVSWLLSVTMLPVTLAQTLREISDSPTVFLLLVNVFLLIVGCLLDNVAAMVMIAPILAPIAGQYGIDPLHFGFVFVLNSVIGLLTPPVGAVLFVVCGISKVPVEKVFKEAFPLFLWQVAVLFLVTYVPIVSVGLPHFFGFGR